MKNAKDIKPIPEDIVEAIRTLDTNRTCALGIVKFYAYLCEIDGDLAKVTVAAKTFRKKKWVCKQVAVHFMHEDFCLIKDIEYSYIGGYRVGWHAEGMTNKAEYFEGSWGACNDCYFEMSYQPIVNMHVMKDFPQYKYSAADYYLDYDLFAYLRTWEEYPQAEYLVKFGMSRIAKSTQILKKIGSDRGFAKFLTANRTYIGDPKNDVKIPTILRAYKERRDVQSLQIEDEAKKGLKHYKRLQNFFGHNAPKFFEYLSEKHIGISEYSDYFDACTLLGLDMSEQKNVFPHDFRRWHDIRIDESVSVRVKLDEEKRKEFYQKFLDVSRKYESMELHSDTGYVTLIARSPGDLIQEGNKLDHCVGRMGYDAKFTREETLIFFVRRADAQDTPFVTVEFSIKNKCILQQYGRHDTKPDEETYTYINSVWFPHAVKAIKALKRLPA